MKLHQARRDAKHFSQKYGTFWYVREVTPGDYQPWAHDSDDERTVATYFCGAEW